MSAHLTVHFSGLPAAALAALSGIAPATTSADDGDAQACALFSLRGADLPLAAITYAHDFGTPPAAWCARLDPVCLLPSAATLRLLDLASAPLPDADARALFDLVSRADVIPGVRWRYGAPLRWYVEADTAPDLRTVPPTALPGGDVAAGRPHGTDARRWQAWLNELHMLLFDAAPNLAREARDLPPANGLWLWGGGTAPVLAPTPFVAVWSDEPVVGGLARLAGLTHNPAPHTPDSLQELPAGHNLLGLGSDAANPDHLAPWLVALQAALDTGRVQSVTLLAGGGTFPLRRRGLFARLRRVLFSR
jgi:hypothetical protein